MNLVGRLLTAARGVRGDASQWVQPPGPKDDTNCRFPFQPSVVLRRSAITTIDRRVMFRTAPVAEPAHDVMVPAEQLVPLSVLALDMTPPSEWDALLAERAIPLLVDDLGRDAVSRDHARMLITEHRVQQEASEARRRAVREEQERKAIEADRAFRAALPKGLPWYATPDGVSPAEAWRAAELAAQPRRAGVLEEALSGESMTYHPWPSTDDES
jgi:hypothetical protein